MGKFIDLTGQVFGRLTVLRRGEDYVSKNGRRRIGWLCSCSCGNPNIIRVRAESLRSGETKSCGCLEKENLQKICHRRKFNKYSFEEDYVIGYTSNGDSFLFDRDDYPRVSPYCWNKTNYGYFKTDIPGKQKESMLLHRFVTGAAENEIVDHINHDISDNRKCNLRAGTRGENNSNQALRSDNTSGVTGVYATRNGKWTARIGNKREYHRLGTFEHLEDAVAARKAAEEKYFGEYSYDNSMAAVPRIAV